MTISQCTFSPMDINWVSLYCSCNISTGTTDSWNCPTDVIGGKNIIICCPHLHQQSIWPVFSAAITTAGNAYKCLTTILLLSSTVLSVVFVFGALQPHRLHYLSTNFRLKYIFLVKFHVVK
jgi:hypothetical protein